MKHTKHIKGYKLFESNSEIESLCSKWRITNYTINSDGSVDVDGDVDLQRKGLTKLPIKFNWIIDSFDCFDNKLTTLENCPNIVDGNFNCMKNSLTSLIGSPKWVEGYFSCSRNQLTNLEGCPERVIGDFFCGYNKIEVLVDGPKYVGGDFNCIYNVLREIQFCPKFEGRFDFERNPIQEVFDLIPQEKYNYDTLEYFTRNDMLRFENGEWVCLRTRLNDWLNYVGEGEFMGNLKNYKMV